MSKQFKIGDKVEVIDSGDSSQGYRELIGLKDEITEIEDGWYKLGDKEGDLKWFTEDELKHTEPKSKKSKWQPIETVPRNVRVLVWYESFAGPIVVKFTDDPIITEEYTHWRPMIKGPKD